MVRTRFAPSPTGYLHIGSLRTVLYDYLFTRKEKGTFILRIEDTDQKRFVPGALENLISILNTFGIDYDEGPIKGGKYGPYIQSERTDIYRRHAQELIDKGAAYRCFCTEERLEEMRKRQAEAKQAPMYDRTCMKLGAEEVEKKISEGLPFVIRQKIPHGRTVKFDDLIRGTIEFETQTIDDQVLMKSDGFPTYHLAVVVDDHLMEITHVMRGEEWVPSTPKHILLYEAFGWEPPRFAHLPLLLNKDKSKLSKRQGDVSVEEYLNKGYSKEALINFVAFLGWHPGEGEETEIFTLDDLIEKFSLEKVHKAGAVFDTDKLDWFNFHWQKRFHHEKLDNYAKQIDPGYTMEKSQKNDMFYKFTSPEAANRFAEYRGGLLLELCKSHIPEEWMKDKDFLTRTLVTTEEKILKRPVDIKEYIGFYFDMKEFPKELILNPKMKVDEPTALLGLRKSLEILEKSDDFDNQDKIKESLLKLVIDLGLKNGQVLWPLRVALSGEEFSPGTFELIWALGKEESLKRIRQTIDKHFTNKP